jgi:hypothetical protein
MQQKMKDNSMSAEEIDTFLTRMKEGVLCSNGEDGYPYCTPVNYIYLDGRICIHGSKKGKKIGNLRKDPRCCFTVMDPKGFEYTGETACNTTTVYESVIIRGKAVIVTDEDEKFRILRAMVDRIVPDKRTAPMETAKVPPTEIVIIDAESVTGKYHRPLAGHKVVDCRLRSL